MPGQSAFAPAPLPVFGRPARVGETYYSIPGTGIFSASSTALVVNTDFYFPIYVTTPVVVDQLAFEVVTPVAGNTRIGLYAADRDWQPVGGPLADSGDISTAVSSVKTYTPASSIALPAGRYLTVMNHAVLPAVRVIFVNSIGIQSAIGASPAIKHFRVSRTYGAFPTPGTNWDTAASDVNAHHPVLLRISQP